MKKNLFFVFTMLCALSFFTACSDDDENKTVDGWKAMHWKEATRMTCELSLQKEPLKPVF